LRATSNGPCRIPGRSAKPRKIPGWPVAGECRAPRHAQAIRERATAGRSDVCQRPITVVEI